MGTLRSQYDHSEMSINGIVLGVPARELDAEGNVIEKSVFMWDDGRLPNGEILESGEIVLDVSEDNPDAI